MIYHNHLKSMCGILGSTIICENFENALHTIAHRGPDGERTLNLQKCMLGFVRLAIRDCTEKAMQPMASDDKTVYLVYNGEIYGAESLKQELQQKGYVFKTTSDTEIVLNAYLEYGEKFVERIDGMFALAIYDNQKEKIFLYRDRVGIKPLYYYYNGRDISFASELKAILALHDDIAFQRDNTAIYDYFTYRYIPDPKTLYKEIRKLEPACRLSFDMQKRTIYIEKYWELNPNENMGGTYDQEEVCEQTRCLISQSVKEQLVSDVPVGTFLSGGIDSSVVSAEIFRMTNNVHAFSMGFQINNEEEKSHDETLYAKMLADLYNFPITYGKFDMSTLKEVKARVRDWYDEPFADQSCWPTYMISKLAKQNHVPVILTGDGGDEVFGGYLNYSFYNQKVGNRKPWSIWCDLYTKVLKPYISNYEFVDGILDGLSLFAKGAYAWGRCDKKDFAKELKIGWGYDDYWYFRKYYNPDLPPITRAQYIDFMTYLPADILTKVDRAAMQNSIETRVPLLSKKIVEFSFGLPQENRCPNSELKGVMKRAYEGIIPNEILYKEKHGFSLPGSYFRPHEEIRFTMWEECWK